MRVCRDTIVGEVERFQPYRETIILVSTASDTRFAAKTTENLHRLREKRLIRAAIKKAESHLY